MESAAWTEIGHQITREKKHHMPGRLGVGYRQARNIFIREAGGISGIYSIKGYIQYFKIRLRTTEYRHDGDKLNREQEKVEACLCPPISMEDGAIRCQYLCVSVCF